MGYRVLPLRQVPNRLDGTIKRAEPDSGEWNVMRAPMSFWTVIGTRSRYRPLAGEGFGWMRPSADHNRRQHCCLPWSPNTCLVRNAFEMERVRANSEAEAGRKGTGTALASRKQAKAEKKQQSLAALEVRPLDLGALIRVCFRSLPSRCVIPFP